ncbi:MAG: cyclase family protein [Planctomycetota bacterium]|nr:MAG: cyclase family protein [Planctomycetota bacterium]
MDRQDPDKNLYDNCLADVLAAHRVIDLSKRIEPSKVSGPVGLGPRKYEIKSFTFPPGEIMHEIEMENHISTHVEAPSHFMEPRHGRSGMDVSEVPLETFYGPAVFVNLARCGKGEEILPPLVEDAGVRPNDIVLFGNGPYGGQDRPYLGQAIARYLADLLIKMVGIDDTVFPENPAIVFKDLQQYYIHDYLLSKDIPIIEGLVNLDALPVSRFTFFGVPPAMGGLDSFPIRAIAFV